MIPVIGFCGASGSGKTTLLAGVIAEMHRRGFSVGAVKHHGHGGAVVEPAVLAGKDTARLADAGAARVLLSHPGGISLSGGPAEGALDPTQLTRLFFSGLDMVLVEGFKKAAIAKIEVVASGARPLLPAGGRLLALARRGGSGQEAGLPVLDADDPAAVADLVAAEAAAQAGRVAPQAGISLRVGGCELSVNPFVARILADTLRGMVATLKGGDAPGGIEVRLD